MDEPDAQITTLGTHLVRIDGDRIYITVRGRLTAQDIRGLFRLARAVRENQPFAFFFYDGRDATAIDPDARKSAPEGKDVAADLRVVFGLSFAVGIFLQMLIRAQRTLLHRDVRFHVFDGEDEARTFFEQECIRIRAGRPS